MPLEVGDKDLRIDLLFYHLKLRRFVVVELKSVDFEPSFVGQLNVYLSAVDDLLKHHDDLPTIGLLLCKTKDQTFVEYALRGIDKPMGVAAWETHLVEVLPKDLEGSLPTIAQIEAELARPAIDAGKARKHAPGRQKGKRRRLSPTSRIPPPIWQQLLQNWPGRHRSPMVTGMIYVSDVKEFAPSEATRSINVGGGSPGSSHTGASAIHVRATLLANFTLATASPRAVARAAGDSSR